MTSSLPQPDNKTSPQHGSSQSSSPSRTSDLNPNLNPFKTSGSHPFKGATQPFAAFSAAPAAGPSGNFFGFHSARLSRTAGPWTVTPQSRAPRQPETVHASAWNSVRAMRVTAELARCVSPWTLRIRNQLQNGYMFSKAPWFHPPAVADDGLIDSYAESVWLSGELYSGYGPFA